MKYQSNLAQRSWQPLIAYIILLHFAWILTWLLFLGLKNTVLPRLGDESIAGVWWFIAHFVVWLPPIFAYIDWIEGANPLTYLHLSRRISRGIIWGILFSTLIPLLAWILPSGKPEPVYCKQLWLLFGSSLAAPITEEIVFRGFLLEQLRIRLGFLSASLISSVLFFTIHIIGWFFSSDFPSINQLLLLAINLIIFGVSLCYFNRASGSLLTSIIYHWCNNFFFRRLPCFFP
ncbi:MAG TPA: type II CAAX endopeptidase family protein [Coleofasciculaceae cyanobacterium]